MQYGGLHRLQKPKRKSCATFSFFFFHICNDSFPVYWSEGSFLLLLKLSISADLKNLGRLSDAADIKKKTRIKSQLDYSINKCAVRECSMKRSCERDTWDLNAARLKGFIIRPTHNVL